LSRINKSATGTISKAELGNLLDTFKTDILGSLSEQIDTLKIQNKKNDENVALSIFCPKCRKKHALRECPLDSKAIETCVICANNHDTKECSSLPGLKAVFNDEGVSKPVDPLYFIAKRPWKNPQPNQSQGFRPQQFSQSSKNNWNLAWQPWAQPHSQPWNQGWKNPYGSYAQYQQYSP